MTEPQADLELEDTAGSDRLIDALERIARDLERLRDVVVGVGIFVVAVLAVLVAHAL